MRITKSGPRPLLALLLVAAAPAASAQVVNAPVAPDAIYVARRGAAVTVLDRGRPFATVMVEPSAELERNREVLLVWSERAEEVDDGLARTSGR